jgi:general secretion pathway protein E
LRGVLAQRLVRRLCRQCCGSQENAEQWAREIRRRVPGIDGLGALDLRRATGCTACGNTGYAGRTTIAELMVVDAEIERLILSAASDADLEKAARSRGMLTMYESGMAKVWTGVTTIDEVLSATRAG